MTITTLGIGAAVTPTVVKTTFSHYTNRKPRAQKPTAHISYDQGLHLIKSFLLYASHHTVEDVQAFTSQWVPHPTWTRTENVAIPRDCIVQAAEVLVSQLGKEGIRAVGGSEWWQWRCKDSELKAEWVEMRSDYTKHQRTKTKSRRVMLYIHGGAYFFGSVDEHRYQLQRHARKLGARVFAPRYRLAPQFPFPCGLLDCLAAYKYLLTIHDASEIVIAGDSAGGGAAISLLCILRDQKIPLPAGAVLISPWVDLTHSFPSLSRGDGFDYIPAHGFMQKPSRSWPPPNEDELTELFKTQTQKVSPGKALDSSQDLGITHVDTGDLHHMAQNLQPPLSLHLDGKEVVIKDQIQLYTTNQLISHPLVSPVLQPSLGGLPPLLIMVGDGELLRDEQIYLAHKAANPSKYKLNKHWQELYDPDGSLSQKYPPTSVQLQVWEDLCHVAPTLSFTRPAKFMYRSVAQFGAWALSRAQNRSITIMDDENSDDSSGSSDEDAEFDKRKPQLNSQVGKAGDALPPFKNHMIREQVDRHGNVFALPPAASLPAMQMDNDLIGVVKEGPIRKWLAAKQEWDTKYASTRRKVHKRRLQDARKKNHHTFGPDERPPPSALAGRQYDVPSFSRTQKIRKSWGLGIWSSWSWKHDEKTMQREADAEQEQLVEQQNTATETTDQDDRKRSSGLAPAATRSRRKTVSAQESGQDANAQTLPNNVPAPISSTNAASMSSTTYGTTDAHVTDPPIFLPKWKTNLQHVRETSKDDAGSIYSQTSRIVPDNASTRAVFSAAGVQKEQSTDAQVKDWPTGLNDRSSTPAFDHVGGYDTPTSRRSVERLQRHQTDRADSQSINSSMLMSVNDSLAPRGEAIRSPSSMAIVQAEGVISDHNETNPAESSSRKTLSATDGDTTPGLSSPKSVEKQEADGETTPTAEKRPILYDRQDTEFKTAHEHL